MLLFWKTSVISFCTVFLKLSFAQPTEPEIRWIEDIESGFQVPSGAEFSSTLNHNGAVVCRLNVGSLSRKEDRFDASIEGINLCTHVIFSWFYINSLYKIVHGDNFSELKKAKDLISKYPTLKILLEITLGHEMDANGKQEFMKNLTGSEEERSRFIGNTKRMLQILRKLGFAGLHLETGFYFYSDKLQFIHFAKELKEELQKDDFLVTTEIEAHSKTRLTRYYGGSIGETSRIFDLLFVRGFHFQTNQEPPVTGHNSPLYSSGLNQESINDNLKYIIDEEKADPNSLVLGIPLYGRLYSLKTPQDVNPFGFNEQIDSGVLPAESVRLKTIMGYNEICTTALLESESWKMFWDNKAKSPFLSQKNSWMSFDNPQSVYDKVIATRDFGLRGVMAFYVDFDDYRGSCSNITFPILRTINYALGIAKIQSFKMEYSSLALAPWGWAISIVVLVLTALAVVAYKIGRKFKADKFNEHEMMTFTRGIPALGQPNEAEGHINPDSLPYDSAYEIPSTNYEIGSF